VTRTPVEWLLECARARLVRLTPFEAFRAAAAGAVLVDTRSEDERRSQGWLIPGAVHHPLSTLLWRLDPGVETSNAKPPLDSWIVVLCREGYSSSLAAVWLQDIGFERATDVIGGVAGWQRAGLPVESYPNAAPCGDGPAEEPPNSSG
jgi:rhodanese-related sulfurtransferase